MNLSISEVRELAGQATAKTSKDFGTAIAVLDRGFVYVGKCATDGEYLTIESCRNIRYWGTKNGLGELAGGPTKETKTDDVGTVIAPMKSIIHIIPCKPNCW